MSWPTLEDIDDSISTPGVVGFTSAARNADVLLEQWGVDRSRSILIGILERKIEV
ncbi:MAG: hypothetical protein ABSD20_21250 [Terriglobales bacterium]